MKKLFLLIYTILLPLLGAYGQQNNIIQITGQVTGQVTDQEAKGPLPGVNVYVKGTVTGTVTKILPAIFCYVPV